MQKHPVLLLSILLGALLVLAACGGDEGYSTTFDEPEAWAVGADSDVEGAVVDGRYELLVKRPVGQHWTTAGVTLDDGIYQVETTQLEGNEDAGYGLVLRLNTSDSGDDFYLFEISSDGFAFIARCEDDCASRDGTIPLVGDGWFETPLIKTGLNQTNTLRVDAEGGNFIFFINGNEVGRASDSTLRRGDIGLMVETLGFPGVKVAFDNVSVEPIPSAEE